MPRCWYTLWLLWTPTSPFRCGPRHRAPGAPAEGFLFIVTTPIHALESRSVLAVSHHDDDDDDLDENYAEYPSSQPSSISNSSSPRHHPNGGDRAVPPSSAPCAPHEGEKGDPAPRSGCADDPYLRLPAEPESGAPDVCSVGVKLPDGRRVQRRFCKRDTLQVERADRPDRVFSSGSPDEKS